VESACPSASYSPYPTWQYLCTMPISDWWSGADMAALTVFIEDTRLAGQIKHLSCAMPHTEEGSTDGPARLLNRSSGNSIPRRSQL
jgi:hypothetical protein